MITTGVIGLSYRTAPLDLRAKAAFGDGQKIALARQLQAAGIGQCVVLSTCNRSEVYYAADAPDPAAVRDVFLQVCGEPLLAEHLYHLQGRPAMEQLFRVAAGLDSLVLGEDQILGQLVQAADFARATGSSDKELNRIIQNAVTCAKAVKTAYPVSSQPLSLCYIGMKQLDQNFGITGKTACVVGGGKMAQLAVQHLCAMGCAQIFLCSRSRQAAEPVLQQYPHLQWVEFSLRAQAMAQSDIVVSATSAPHMVVQEQQVQNCKEKMAFLDLAVPRDIDPTAMRSGWCLLDVDSLKQTSEQNLQKRRTLAARSEQMLSQAIDKTEQWLAASAVDAPIQTLRQRVQEVEQDTAQLLCERLQLDSHQQKILRKLLHAGMNRLLRTPIHQLKESSTAQQQQQLAQAVEYLFSNPKE